MESNKERNKKIDDIDNTDQSEMDQTAEEFIGDNADWSEDISEYKKRKK